jgi:CDP-diacylglycerol--glycerol-3-phosphate 3-phosphatidyltransferase
MKQQQQVERLLVLETVGWLKARNSQEKGKTKWRAPTVYLLKAHLQAELTPLVRAAAESGITANQVTLMSSGLSVVFGVILAWQGAPSLLLLLLPLLLFIRMALNAMDGMLARDYGQASRLGVYLNELGDVVSDVFLYSPFALLPALSARWMIASILLAVLSEMAGVMAPIVGAGRRYDGPMGKSDRALVFGALGLWLGLGGRLAPWVADWFPPLLCMLLVTTVVNRVRNALYEKEIVHG